MYDIKETKLSQEYMRKITNTCEKISIMGGWATYLYVQKHYKKAFGEDYLKSRDIDVFVKKKDEACLKKAIDKLGFKKSAYYFRYELTYNRQTKKIISTEKSRSIPIYRLLYIFLDVFSNKKLDKLNSWVIKDLKVKTNKVNGFPVVNINTLIKMKSISFFEREKLDKELKDACDLYALMNYADKKIRKTKILKKVIKKIKNRNDLCDFIAENVLLDPLKNSVVKRTLENF